MRRDGALRILPRGAHHDRPGRFPRAPPAHLASPHPRPRGTPCTCSSRAGARTGPLHPHSLQRLLLHLCSQMLGPAHSRQSLRMRWWSHLCCHTNYQSASARTLRWHRGIAAVRGRARARPLRLCALTVRCCEQTLFFFVRSWRLRQSGPRPPRSSRACRAVLPGRRHRTHPPATSSPLLALAPRCASAVSLCNPATAVSTSGQWRLQHQEWRKNAARHAQR